MIFITQKFITICRRAHQVPTLNQMKKSPLPPYFFTIHLKINLQSMLRSSKWFVSLKFSYQNHAQISLLPHVCHVPCPYHLPSFDQPKNIWQGVSIMKLLIIKFSPVSGHFLPNRPKYSPQHPVHKLL